MAAAGMRLLVATKHAANDELPAITVGAVGRDQAIHARKVRDASCFARLPRSAAALHYPHVELVRRGDASECTRALVQRRPGFFNRVWSAPRGSSPRVAVAEGPTVPEKTPSRATRLLPRPKAIGEGRRRQRGPASLFPSRVIELTLDVGQSFRWLGYFVEHASKQSEFSNATFGWGDWSVRAWREAHEPALCVREERGTRSWHVTGLGRGRPLLVHANPAPDNLRGWAR